MLNQIQIIENLTPEMETYAEARHVTDIEGLRKFLDKYLKYIERKLGKGSCLEFQIEESAFTSNLDECEEDLENLKSCLAIGVFKAQ
jgi:hypothetical protein